MVINELKPLHHAGVEVLFARLPIGHIDGKEVIEVFVVSVVDQVGQFVQNDVFDAADIRLQ